MPYLVISLVGAQRVSLDLARMHDEPTDGDFTITLTMEALYDLLQGNPLNIERRDGNISLAPDGGQLIIHRSSHRSSYRVWMSEIALAWNMLAGFQATARTGHDWRAA